MSQKFYFEASDGNHKFTPRFEASGGAGKPLKPATTTTLGGIIVGEDLEITEEGVLSVATTDVVEEDNTSPVTSEAVRTAIEGVLPDVNSSDNGKVLSVVNGEWEKADADFLPKVTPSDNGKLLGVVEGEWGKVTPEDELPPVTASDDGNVLGVVNGAWGKMTLPSGAFIINGTIDTANDNAVTVDKTDAEVLDAIQNEDLIFFIARFGNGSTEVYYCHDRYYEHETEGYEYIQADAYFEFADVNWVAGLFGYQDTASFSKHSIHFGYYWGEEDDEEGSWGYRTASGRLEAKVTGILRGTIRWDDRQNKFVSSIPYSVVSAEANNKGLDMIINHWASHYPVIFSKSYPKSGAITGRVLYALEADYDSQDPNHYPSKFYVRTYTWASDETITYVGRIEIPIPVLPSVTASDNGMVLGVVNGAWDKVTPEKELPAVTASDNGKVLEVANGAWNKVTPEKELPSVTSTDNGKVLEVVNGAWNKTTPEKELPTVTASDNGKVLGVSSGSWQKVTPEKELPSVTASDNGEVLGVVNGTWGKMALPSVEENTFIVTVTVTYDNTDPNNEQTILTPDKTESEMTAAFRAGKFVVAIFSFPGYDYNTYDLPCVNYSIQEWEDNEFSVYAEFCRVFPVPAPTTGYYGRYEIAMNRKTGYFQYYHPADSDTEYEPSVTWEYNGDNFSAEKYDITYQKCNITWDSTQNKFVPSLNFSSVTASGKLGNGTNSAAFNFTVIEGAKRYPVICYGLERISNIYTILLYAVNMTHTDDPTIPLPDNFEIRLYKWTSEANITYCGSKTISALPPVTASDNGKVLGVVNGAWSKVTPEQELPSVTSTDNGDLLSVVNGQWSKSDPPYTKTGSVVTPSQDFMDAVLASLPIYNGTVV